MFRERVIALVGHILVHPETAPARIHAGVARFLDGMGADRLFKADRPGDEKPDDEKPGVEEFWTFVTPLAPGSDYILACEVLDQLETMRKAAKWGQPRRYRLRVVQSVPLAALVAAWDRKGGFLLGTPDGVKSGPEFCDLRGGKSVPNHAKVVQLLRKFVTERPEVEEFVDLTLPWRTLGQVEGDALKAALKQTDDYLHGHAHDVIAALDPKAALGDVGTRAFVEKWRARHPADSGATGLHVIDLPDTPALPPTD